MSGPSPRDLTPRHLADRILRSRSALQGERKPVTVLFVDVVHSMDLAARLGAEEWHRALDRFFRVLADAVHRDEGTINQYTGDGIMALFGAPIAHEDHARRACRAACSLEEALAPLRAWFAKEWKAEFSIRAGLHSGEVVVGAIGDDLRMDYTAQGHTVGLAQRMEQLAPPDGVIATHTTVDLAGPDLRTEPLGPVRVKGAEPLIEAFRVLGLEAERHPSLLRHHGPALPFVGRSPELRMLNEVWNSVSGGSGRLVGIVGDAGIGKSRLCAEALSTLRPAPRSWTVRGASHDQAVAWSAARALAKSVLDLTPEATADVVRTRIAEIGRSTRPRPEVGEALERLLFAPTPGDIDADGASDALVTLLLEESRSGPIVLALDDAHWFDTPSQGLVDSIAAGTAAGPVLVLATFRPGLEAPWARRANYLQLPLAPLPRTDAERVIRSALGDDPSVQPLEAELHERSAGNPFFLTEIVRALSQEGTLVGQIGAYQLTVKPPGTPLPATVQAVIEARIDLLDEQDKDALKAASVIGRRFLAELLGRVLRTPVGEVRARLRRLEGRELIVRAPDAGEPAFTFSHPLIHEVAYRSLVGDTRRELHRRVAQTIEDAMTEHLGDEADAIARHWQEAGTQGQARRWRQLAALRVRNIQTRRPDGGRGS